MDRPNQKQFTSATKHQKARTSDTIFLIRADLAIVSISFASQGALRPPTKVLYQSEPKRLECKLEGLDKSSFKKLIFAKQNLFVRKSFG